jgi:hypothetical protein
MRYLLLLVTAFALQLNAQKNVFLKIYPKVNGSDLALGTDYIDQQGVVFNLDYFNYYLSGLSVTHDGGQVLDLSDTVFLVKSSDFILYLGYLDVTSVEALTFSIGVPPNLNTASGTNAVDISVYPANHPLSFQDPSMYWGWSAGYIFLVTGGNADSNADDIADAYFELHNLGEHNYVQTSLPVVQTNTGNDQIDIYLDCNIDQWLKNVPLESISILHGTTGYNSSSMANVTTEPVFTQPLAAGISWDKLAKGELYVSEDVLYWKGFPENAYLKVTDLSGKDCLSLNQVHEDDMLDMKSLKSGAYVVALFDQEGQLLRTLKFVR